MKMETSWDGVQILAETEKDKEILQYLVDSLPEENIGAYALGVIGVIDKDAYNGADGIWCFETDEIKNAKLTINITR